MQEKIAIIDLGTNTFHLLIAANHDKGFEILYREKVPVKLGMGGINQGVITEEAVQRGLICLRQFAILLEQWQVRKSIGFGTSALRSASNGEAVLEQFRKETHLNLKLISGDEEAVYIYYGVHAALHLGDEKSLIVDIGGGSVEFIIANGKSIYWKQSFEMGAQRLLELYHRHDPILVNELEQLDAHFEGSLKALHDAVQLHHPVTLAGSSGTFDTLSEIHCIREGIKPLPDSPETPLTVSSYQAIHKELVSKNRADRLLIPGMIEMRVDMIVVASCLVKYLVDSFHFDRIRVSSYSLKEGVLARWNVASEPRGQASN